MSKNNKMCVYTICIYILEMFFKALNTQSNSELVLWKSELMAPGDYRLFEVWARDLQFETTAVLGRL